MGRKRAVGTVGQDKINLQRMDEEIRREGHKAGKKERTKAEGNNTNNPKIMAKIKRRENIR